MISLEKNEDFERAVAFVTQTGKSLFLTGRAGTGKTTFLKYIKDHCYKNMAVLASTGVAAINAGGVTIHSFFQLPFGMYVPDAASEWGAAAEDGLVYNKMRLLSKLRFNHTKLSLIRELDLLVIDEISMVRADLLDAVDDVLRVVRRRSEEPFGGVQMVFIGDLFQLPPVVKKEELQLLQQQYESPFFFSSRVFKTACPVCLELNKIYRQNDSDFIELLNRVRNGCCTDADLDLLNSHYRPDFEPPADTEYITLTSHNYIADNINRTELEKLPGRLYLFKAKVTRDFPERAYPAEEKLQLKVGAQIMFIKNDKGEDRRYYNGKIGTVTAIAPDGKIKIEFRGEEDPFELSMETWSNIRYNFNREKNSVEEEELGTFEQYPIRLAWAVTIHKSQGLTFDRAIIDASSSFAPGQVYVALSRLRSLGGLVLRSSLNHHCISTDQHVIRFAEKETEAAKQIPALLEEEQKAYIGETLLRSFDWEKIREAVLNDIEEFKGRKLEDQERFLLKTRKIYEAVCQQANTAGKFGLQLKALLAQAPVAGYENLHNRVIAGVEWFDKALDTDVVTPLKSLLELAHTRKRTTKYQKELRGLLLLMERKRLQLQQAKALARGLYSDLKLPQLMRQLSDMQESVQGKIAETLSPSVHLPKVDTRAFSLALYKKGKTIAEIAAERNLKPATIENHLMQYLPSGEVKLDIFISPPDVARVIAYLQNHSPETGSAEIKNAFGDEFSYTQIRAARTWYSLQRKAAEKKAV